MIESAEREMFINQIVDTSLKDNIKGSAIVMTFEKKPDVLEEVKANIISRIKKLTEKCCYETPTKAKIKKDIEKAIYNYLTATEGEAKEELLRLVNLYSEIYLYRNLIGVTCE